MALSFPRKTLFTAIVLLTGIIGLSAAAPIALVNKTPKVVINGISFFVDIADTPVLRERGLMDVELMAANQGMLFVFDELGQHDFWNKNTLIPLDLVYVNQNTIAEIGSLPVMQKNEPPIIYHPQAVADAVLELNAGAVAKHGFKVGDEIRISR